MQSEGYAVFHPSGLCANMTFSFDAEVPPQSRTISISRTDTELSRAALEAVSLKVTAEYVSDPKFRPAALTEAGHVREFADVYQLFEVCPDLLKDPTCGIGRRSRERSIVVIERGRWKFPITNINRNAGVTTYDTNDDSRCGRLGHRGSDGANGNANCWRANARAIITSRNGAGKRTFDRRGDNLR